MLVLVATPAFGPTCWLQTATICICPEWGAGEAGWKYYDKSALRMDYVSISARTQKRRGGGRGVHVLDADGFKLLPLFSIRHEAFTSLIFQTMRGGLMFWVNELSVYPSASAPPPSCFHFLLKVEMLVHWLWSPSRSGVPHFAALHTQMPLGVQLPILTCNRAWSCIWSLLLSPLFPGVVSPFFWLLFFQHY